MLNLDEVTLERRLLARVPTAAVQKAIRTASSAHQDTLRDEGTPYIRHPLRVALILAEELDANDEDLVCAAVLHDVLEDPVNPAEFSALCEQFGERVAGLVRCLTDEFRSDALPRDERKARYLARVAGEADDCVLVKLCDRLDNLRSLPYSPHVDKRRQTVDETRRHLAPLVERGNHQFKALGRLMDQATYKLTLVEFQRIRPLYAHLTRHLIETFGGLARELDLYPLITGRTKSLESFAEKIQRKHYQDPFVDATDLCGIRVITHLLADVGRFADAARRTFHIDDAQSEDKEEKLAFREFGYLSRHFIIQLRNRPRIEGLGSDDVDRLMELKAELQIRTLAQHVWADLYHEMGYKNEFRLPGRWERQFARMAAQLESCDRGFQQIKDEITAVESSYSGYMTEAELRNLEFRLETLLEIMKPGEPGRVKVVHRLIRAYLAHRDVPVASLEGLLVREEAALAAFPPALRDAGVAFCKISQPGDTKGAYSKGQNLLRQAFEANTHDVDARCSLGGTLRRAGDRAGALACYRDAHVVDPSNPYALSNYVVEELLQGGQTSILPFFQAPIRSASARCRQQIEVGVNLPWAFFDLGLFHLFLGNAHDGLTSYARGIVNTPSWMAQTAHGTIHALVELGLAIAGIEWVDRLLAVARGMPGRPSVPEPWPDPAAEWLSASRRVLVVSGGCAGLESRYRDQLDRLRDALRPFRGTLVGGGTRSGVAGVVGDLQEAVAGDTLVTMGYLPSGTDPGDHERIGYPGGSEQIDRRYGHHRRTDGPFFSVSEPLAFWQDLVAAGGDPAKVRLVGFNGGTIARCEYRIALALGAEVAVVEGSGRQADDLLKDPLWNGLPNLRRIRPADGRPGEPLVVEKVDDSGSWAKAVTVAEWLAADGL